MTQMDTTDRPATDLSTIGGVAAAFVLILSAIALGANPFAFFDIPSALIVLCGTLAVTIASFSFAEIWNTQKLAAKTIFYTHHDLQREASQLIGLAEMARRDGPLSLQNKLAAGKTPLFLEKGLSMVIDGIGVEMVDRTLHQEVLSMAERHRKGASILRKAAEIAPAMGLIGTLIGLVQMLNTLDDPSSIGPAMAVALLSTLYGAVLSFMVFTPLASKLERNSREEVLAQPGLPTRNCRDRQGRPSAQP